MKIIAYRLSEKPNHALEIRPATRVRQWMEDTPEKFAYRCLPLQIANTFGWDIFARENFMISYTGGVEEGDLRINYESIDPDADQGFASSAFGFGMITFHTGYVFRTDPGWDLMIVPPANYDEPTKFATPLAGIVETSWLDFTFTVNWKLHEAGSFHWKKEWPVARIVPIPHDYSNIEAEILPKSKMPDEESYDALLKLRRESLYDMRMANISGKDFRKFEKDDKSTYWEKNYYTGKKVTGERVPDHTIKRVFPKFKQYE